MAAGESGDRRLALNPPRRMQGQREESPDSSRGEPAV